ncbi:HupE/UreJ family protein [Solitalea koreensis]|uniref:HupE / UreJ protein n=1 Tax=Solitalea koreensis TaxID=543615 RepID=A0A521D271_9SPHI|nr:HupE/UreJ family protein [Solitalea koreensis]SMO65788.1 HupE / UreJ protein [Solitalea koreensis]
MNQFCVFLSQGFHHILDPNGYDHILFLFAICAIYSIQDWKHLLWIVTSFTIAHSITLALSVLNIINLDGAVIEFLIAFTIFFTCIENLFLPRLHNYRVLFSGFFGLIHGLGFSRLLKELFMGMEFNVLTTLLPFNLGLECGQLVIISVIMFLLFLTEKHIKLSPKLINYIISVPVLLQSIQWLWERKFWQP